jgi:hypothetical protein
MTPVRRLWLKAPAALTGVELACVIGLLLLAAALRCYRLQDFPSGYHNDEVTDAHIIETVVAGRRAIYFPEDTGSEPLYMYFSALFAGVLGSTVLALRLPSVFLSMVALCAVWVLTRRLFGRMAAGVALGAMSVSWWSVLLGRITLHVAPVAPMLALALYFFWRGIDSPPRPLSRRGRRDGDEGWCLAISGFFIALAFNSYTAARVMPILVIALVMYLALVRRDVILARWRGLLALAVVAVILSAPLAIYLLTHPSAKQLTYSGFDVSQPITDLLAGKPQLVIETTLQTLGMFAFVGDPLPYYDMPGRPLMEPVGMALFLIGAAMLAWRWREPRYGVVLIGLFVTLLPGMLSQPAPNYARTVGAMALVFAVPGIGVDVIWRGARARWGRAAQRIGAVALVALLLGNAVWLTRDFFIVWPAQAETRWWMQTGLKEVARALEADGAGPVAICASSRLIDERVEWWRPAWWIYHYLSPRTEAGARWYDCAESFVIPNATAGVAPRFAFPDVSSLGQLDALPVARWMLSARVEQAAGQSTVVRADPMPVWEGEVKRLASDAPVSWPPEAVGHQGASLPIDFGRALQLTAYEVQGRAAPGTVITVTTYWRVTALLEPRLALFTHVLTGTDVIAQNDHLAITSGSLKPGDVFLQMHRLELPETIERGTYQLAVGIYSQDTGARLKVYDGAVPVADRIFLRLVRVGRPR